MFYFIFAAPFLLCGYLVVVLGSGNIASSILLMVFGIVGVCLLFCGFRFVIFGTKGWMLVTGKKWECKKFYDTGDSTWRTGWFRYITGVYLSGDVIESASINTMVISKVGKYLPIIVYKGRMSVLPWYPRRQPKSVPDDVHAKLIKHLK